MVNHSLCVHCTKLNKTEYFNGDKCSLLYVYCSNVPRLQVTQSKVVILIRISYLPYQHRIQD